jgi:ADP-ribose pyrophosphatase
LDDQDNLTLVRQYRAGAKKQLLEIPAGGLENGESLMDAARRELQEEIGMFPEELDLLGHFWVASSYTTEEITIYLTRRMRPSRLTGDDDERIEVVKMPFSQALDQVMSNEIEDSKTIIGITWAARFLGRL